uniref:(northern house mosquito) hypothetical protein n=1 Tax=Culex pipiens TaxID=7175 RepID=A0A8D8HRT4_CULPI
MRAIYGRGRGRHLRRNGHRVCRGQPARRRLRLPADVPLGLHGTVHRVRQPNLPTVRTARRFVPQHPCLPGGQVPVVFLLRGRGHLGLLLANRAGHSVRFGRNDDDGSQ